ncbi:hypothetical protein J2T22_001210 [Pseudarthrobacter defluvii]|uniref:PA14 domain-containing protein n=1 Tax=Pseudarthrobacter defluvii TaxID=410837 RepID=A0ABT9UEF6_9MICC|nr:galactose oxidase-like domain-containing protein [Pseudarthrobacter defluvii]MDQ0118033.1 hypothetical protein [Pseudarthrobacter defluvii]
MSSRRNRATKFAAALSLAVLIAPSALITSAHAAPCPWVEVGPTVCIDVQLIAPKDGDVLTGTVALESNARQLQAPRGNIVKVEWWLYHPSFLQQNPNNHEGKILMTETLAPSTGTRLDGTWRGEWTVPDNRSVTTRDGDYEHPGNRTYTLPATGTYKIESHVLDEEWTRTAGGPAGRTPPITVTIPGGSTEPPPPVVNDSTATINGQSRPINGTDIYREADFLVRYTRTASQTTSPANQWGAEAAVVAGKVTEFNDRQTTGAPGLAIPDGGFILSGHGQSREWLIANAQVGATVTSPASSGTAPPPPPPVVNDSTATINGQSRPINGTDIYREADFLVRYTRTASQTTSPANQWGAEAAVVAGKVTEFNDRQTTGAPGLAIPDGGFILSGHGQSREWLIANAQVGATVTSPASSGTAPPPPPPPGNCAAYTGEYFNTVDLSGAPALTRCDAEINFSWPGTTGAGPGLDGTNDSARWTRTVNLPTGDQTFTITGDDGVRVKLDGATVIDGWKDQGPSTYMATRSVIAGAHTVIVEHYERYGDATAKFAMADGAATPPPSTGLAASGRWTTPASMPGRAMHATLLRDGRILLIAGSGNDWEGQFLPGTFETHIWNPTTNTFTSVPTPADMFCSGHVTLPDGKILVQGGTSAYAGTPESVSYKGLKSSYIFDPATDTYSKTNDAIDGHWYPTLTKLETGDVWMAGGYDQNGGGSTATEMFNFSQNRWLTAAEVPQTNRYLGTYPHMFLMADGRMFYTGGHTFGVEQPATGSFIYDWRGGLIGDIPGLRFPRLRDQAGSVLLPPAQNQRFMIAGGGSTDFGGSTNTVDVVDMNQANPVWKPGPDLPGSEGRMYLNLTNLPDRSVLATHGATGNRTGDVKRAAIYSPASNVWAEVAADSVGRNYHSSTLLLPDGRVVAIGSNPSDNSYEKRLSIYEPPYLFKGDRPTITAAPTDATYGQAFNLGTTGNVISASLMSPGSATHQTDTNARLVDLPLSGGATKTATIPANKALLPPGPYMLTVLNDVGVPSVAQWINIR